MGHRAAWPARYGELPGCGRGGKDEPQGLKELVEPERLYEPRTDLRIGWLLPIRHAGDDNDRKARPARLRGNDAQNVPTLKPGHLEVQQQHIRHGFLQALQGFLPVSGRMNPVTHLCQEIGQGLADVLIVIDHQQGGRASEWHLAAPRPLRTGKHGTQGRTDGGREPGGCGGRRGGATQKGPARANRFAGGEHEGFTGEDVARHLG